MRSRIPRSATVLATAALALAFAPGVPADAASGADGPQGPSPALTVTGNGYGHGHGMSQWGAKRAAETGLGYQQILAFYYPGTARGIDPANPLTVRITAGRDNNLKIDSARRLRVRDLGRHRSFKLRKSARAWRLKRVGGETRLYYKTGHWHLYRIGGRKGLVGDGMFKSPAGPLTLRLPDGVRRAYRGKLWLSQSGTVNVVTLESYLRGVVAAEMPASWAGEALKAQAVAARTYAARERMDNTGRHYDLCDTSACQVYGGVAAETAATDAAVAATAGEVLVHPSGNPYAFAQFSSSNGGWSSDGGQSYLVAKEDAFDKAVSPYLHWKVTVDTAKLQAAHPEIGTLTEVRITKREGDRAFDAGGWVQTVKLTGTGGSQSSVDIDGSEFRAIYGLRSSYFTFDAVP